MQWECVQECCCISVRVTLRVEELGDPGGDLGMSSGSEPWWFRPWLSELDASSLASSISIFFYLESIQLWSFFFFLLFFLSSSLVSFGLAWFAGTRSWNFRNSFCLAIAGCILLFWDWIVLIPFNLVKVQHYENLAWV